MSIEAAQAFIERLKTDKEFAKKATECKNAEERMALAKVEGYEFSKENISQLSSELTDDELDLIAGGYGICYIEHVDGSEKLHFG